ncbi:MAG: alpha/beta fold hydrolase [Planctomycetota bacterium]
MRGFVSLFAFFAFACTGGPEESPPDWPGEGTIAVSSGRLWVSVVGDPVAFDVLIAVHGGPGMSSGYLSDLDTLAAPSEASPALSVARYDQRGCGDSSVGFDDADQDMDAQVADLLAVCDAVAGERPVHVLGHSWGGLVAAMFASEHPERVRSLILVSSMPADGRASIEADGEMGRHLVDLEGRGVIPSARILPTSAKAFRSLLPVYFHDPKFEPPEALRETSFSPRAYGLALRELGRDYDVRDEVGEIRCPTLIVFGESDPFGQAMGRSMQDALTRSQVEWFDLPRCGHFWQENPEPFYARLREFLAR